MNRISVVVLSYNGKGYLEDCLRSVLAQSHPPYQLIVVDNASSDGSPELVRERFPQAELIRNHRNLGYAGGMNVGLREARGELIALLNQDTVVQENLLAELTRAFEMDVKIGIAGCKILLADGVTIQHAGGIIRYPQALPDHYGYGQLDEGQYDQMREVDYVTGAALAVRKAVLKDVGYFDEAFFPAYYEDADFCFRAREAGYKIVYVPRAVVLHHESSTLGRDSYNYHRAMHRNRLRFILKRYNLRQLQEDFYPAEKEWLRAPRSENERQGLRRAYLETLLLWPSMPWAKAEKEEERMADTDEERLGVREILGALHRSLLEGDHQHGSAEPPTLHKGVQEAKTDDLLQPSFGSQLVEGLASKWHAQERPFVSHKPLIGPLIAFIREMWNSVSTKWFVRAILQQQNEFNEALVRAVSRSLDELDIRIGALDTRVSRSLDELDIRICDNDRDSTALAVEIAKVGYRLNRIENQLAALGERLAGIEQALKPRGSASNESNRIESS